MRTSAMARLAVMGLLLMALMIPLTMTHSVVSERASRRDSATAEISGIWGGAQTIGGPVLVIPYRCSYRDNAGRLQQDLERIFLLPEALEIDGSVAPGLRSRGLFPVVVYDARIKVRGRFAPPDLSRVRPTPDEVLWADATLSIGVSDPKGIASAGGITWNGRRERFVPGVGEVGLFTAGVQAQAPGLSAPLAGPVSFEYELDVRGTRELRFLPAGNETAVKLQSPWPHPSFVGAPLPSTRRVDASGFSAVWRTPYFGRGYPPLWTSAGFSREQRLSQAAASAFGVTLAEPVDIYLQSERAVKYAALFIVLTFVVAFLWEVTSGVLVHPIQYLFVGFAMCIFYLLLVSLAEHVRFDPAYVVASGCTIGLIAWYWSWVLGGNRHGVLMGGALTLLYGYLYLLLRLEDFALLAGSVGLFLVLGLLMFITRRVNWYELRLAARQQQA
jgi:inner membrane protein